MLALALLATFQAADTVRYAASFPNAAHHEAEISVTFPARGHDTLDIRMSRSSPGRYAIHEFAKNVYGVRATNGAGRPVSIVRPDPYRWLVTGHDGTVVFHYTLFADRADGTYSQVDQSHAHLNMPATFAWVAGLERHPIAVKFTVPEGSNWRAATQLIPTRDPLTFTAPHLDYFLDSPTELSNHALRTWTVAGPDGRTDTIRLAVHHLGTDAEVDAYAEMARKVVAEQNATFGETARFDHGTYTFIADYLPWASGDGMEHRNSTILSSTGSLGQGASGLLGTLSHEYFHSWNVERIRPRMLEPFDFFDANPSDALWFAEGFTSYFGPLYIHRAGLTTTAQYAGAVGGAVSAVVNTTARRYGSPMEMSLRAPFVDAAAAIDPTNFGNTFLSYYTWGAGIGLAMDLSLRSRYPGKDLDGYMRLLWQRFGAGGRYEVPRPYTVDDLEHTLGEYAGDADWARDFFARYVRRGDAPPYAELLAHAGFVVKQANVTAPWIGGTPSSYNAQGGLIQQTTQIGSPLYEAGVEGGDRIVRIGTVTITSDTAWRAMAATHKPGDAAPITFVQRGVERTAMLRFGSNPQLQVVPVEADGGTLSEAQQRFRQAWLGSRAR
jgi:predicted metalloprotease with PDZ domain